jgi:hypothetical protein
MQPPPLPVRGGAIESLVLVVAWLLGALRAGGPYPVLAIAGEQGSAKTVLSKLLRAVIDPCVASMRALPRDERELFIAASNGHVLAFDNLSGLPSWLSDTSREHRRCSCPPRRVAGCATPTGSPPPVQPDSGLPALPKCAKESVRHRSSSSHDRAFLARSSMRPRMAYRCCRSCASPWLPLMADFALWVAACETGFRPEGAFEAVYSNIAR